MSDLDYVDVARLQIDKAIELYFDNEFICALTLAGAGEEILGGILKSLGEVNTHDEIVTNIRNAYPETTYGDVTKDLNNARNILKHFVEDPKRLNFKPVDECVLMILRAVYNFVKLRNGKTELMTNFLDDKKMNDTLDAIRKMEHE